MSIQRSILGALGALVLTFGAAYIGSRFPVDEWYAALSKPSWNPPNWLFGPVWSLLYLLMAISVWLVWKKEGFQAAIIPLGVFLLQLVLNVAWSWLFFGLHEMSSYSGELFLSVGFYWCHISYGSPLRQS
jgi:tryptophan-rich sensory protein